MGKTLLRDGARKGLLQNGINLVAKLFAICFYSVGEKHGVENYDSQ